MYLDKLDSFQKKNIYLQALLYKTKLKANLRNQISLHFFIQKQVFL